jgi:hypothetical protein
LSSKSLIYEDGAEFLLPDDNLFTTDIQEEEDTYSCCCCDNGSRTFASHKLEHATL